MPGRVPRARRAPPRPAGRRDRRDRRPRLLVGLRRGPARLPARGGRGGRAAFEAARGRPFPIEQPGTAGLAGEERSPYGFDLGISYPVADPDVLLGAMRAALPAWRDAGAELRAAVCAEILVRLNARSHELAQAVMHTTGQASLMAFQAGGSHAQDRALEAVAFALAAQRRVPAEATWVKPQGKRPPLRMAKSYRVAPRGIALVVGCATFPTWNGYPGLFASLATGNPVLVKPSRRSVLPLAITVGVAREVLAEAGLPPDVVALTVDPPGGRSAAELAVRPEIRLVDFTGSSEFGTWLETHATQAVVFAEKSGVNCVVIDSTDDYEGMLRNLAFSLSLYSGQMCTTPQDLLVPAGGIETDQGTRTVDQVTADLAAADRRAAGRPEARVGRPRRDRGARRPRSRGRRGRRPGHGGPRLVADRAPRVPRRGDAHAAARPDRRGRERDVRERVLRAGHVHRRDRGHPRVPRDLAADGARAGVADRGRVLDGAGRRRAGRGDRPRRRRLALPQPHRAASTSTSRRPSPTTTRPGSTPPPRRRSPTRRSSRRASTSRNGGSTCRRSPRARRPPVRRRDRRRSARPRRQPGRRPRRRAAGRRHRDPRPAQGAQRAELRPARRARRGAPGPGRRSRGPGDRRHRRG